MSSKLEVFIVGEGVRSRDCIVLLKVSRDPFWEAMQGKCQEVAQPSVPSVETVEAIQAWVREHSLGRRISYTIWRLNSDAAVTMFMLRWNNAKTQS